MQLIRTLTGEISANQEDENEKKRVQILTVEERRGKKKPKY